MLSMLNSQVSIARDPLTLKPPLPPPAQPIPPPTPSAPDTWNELEKSRCGNGVSGGQKDRRAEFEEITNRKLCIEAAGVELEKWGHR